MMKYAIAIAKVKVKKKLYHPRPGQVEEKIQIEGELSRAVLGIMLLAGTVIGISGIVFLLYGLISSGGFLPLIGKFFSAITGR
jgi:hypothetical protein